MTRTIWITGATGFVGSHFLYRVLTQSDARVVALVRARAECSAYERLIDTLTEVAWSHRERLDRAALAGRLRVVHGDIERASCGVDASDQGPCDELWHIAASLCFEDKKRAQIMAQNVGGTRHALALAESLACKRFVYVSTAYSCGRVEGEIPEQLHDLERAFNNAYEESKCRAEHEVAAWALRTGSAASILRPSIVVGPRRTYAPGGSDTGLYGFARETARLKRMLAASPRPLQMLGDGSAPVNLIPVDDLARMMCERAEQDFAGGLVHHLTSDRVPNVESLLATVGALCGAGPIGVVRERAQSPSAVEQLMDRRATFYASYLRAPKTFARRAGAPVHVSDAELALFVGSYEKQRRSESIDTCFARSVVQDTLVSYDGGAPDKPALALVNAYGLAADVWVPLARALAREFRIVTWDLREHDGQDCGPAQHVADLRAVLDHHGIESAFVAGFCTGADLALRFAMQHPERVLGLIGLSGALNVFAAEETPFQHNMRKLAGNAARDLEHAHLYQQLLFGARPGYGALVADKEAMLGSMVGALDPALLHLTSAPFRDARTLHAYAKAMCAHYRDAEDAPLSEVSARALFVTGLRDEVAHPAGSRAAAASLAHATLVELPEADHFALYSEPQLPELLRSFARNALSGPGCSAVA